MELRAQINTAKQPSFVAPKDHEAIVVVGDIAHDKRQQSALKHLVPIDFFHHVSNQGHTTIAISVKLTSADATSKFEDAFPLITPTIGLMSTGQRRPSRLRTFGFLCCDFGLL